MTVEGFPDPHPDCKAPHKDKYDYVGPSHACPGQECPSCKSRYLTQHDAPETNEQKHDPIPNQ